MKMYLVLLPIETQLFRNLVNLEVGGDPAWGAISCHSRHLTTTMIQCRDSHLRQEQAALEEGGVLKNQYIQHGACNNYFCFAF